MARKKTNHQFDTPGPLMHRVAQLVRDDPRSLPDLATASGMPFYWLRRFLDRKLTNPSVNRIEHMYTFLTGKGIID